MTNSKLRLQINVDLADFFSRGEEAVKLALGTAGRIKVDANAGDALNLAVPDTSFGTKLSAKLGTVAEVILHGIRSLHAYMEGKPEWYPANKCPFGCADFTLTCFTQGHARRSWYIHGDWSAKSLARTPVCLTPEKCVDRLRDGSARKSLVSSRPFPKLERVFLSVDESGGTAWVRHACATKAEIEASRSSLPWVVYPSAQVPALSWDHELFLWRTPVTQALQAMSLRRVGKPADWIRRCSREAVFVSHTGSQAATDLRASLVSGAKGPAPLPAGTAWPCCTNCGGRTLFSQSLDFRDVSFASLLPGTTAVIFFCAECHIAGEWSKCAEVVWISESQEIVLTGEGGASEVIQLDQYYGFDMLDRSAIESEIMEELEQLAELPDTPGLWMSSSYGVVSVDDNFRLFGHTQFKVR